MFLSAEQLYDLTGLRRPSAQSRWLEARKIRHDRRADGSVVVHELEAQRHLCGGPVSRNPRREEPDLEALFDGR